MDAISVSPMAMGAPTVNYTVTVKLEGEGLEDIYEGMSCTVELVSERVDDVLIIPKRAITTEGRKNYVMVKLEDGTTEQREVTLGFTDGSSYEVKSGLEEGDIVLIGSSINSTSSDSTGSGGDRRSGEMPEDMPDGMQMPSGGEMPSGERPSAGEGGMRGGAAGNS
ncbi:MAG: efflux RND transporter periplasmic adaptor subunit [Peptococcaceae bacterium]|nr:efflux RND transporter periplasmic adaptor subunit [Peptococcaceae bacterium]